MRRITKRPFRRFETSKDDGRADSENLDARKERENVFFFFFSKENRAFACYGFEIFPNGSLYRNQ